MHKKVWKLVYVDPTNSLDAYVPELWANESLAILSENMVMANLVHRDFENEIQNFGDVVNTRKPSSFTATRRNGTDDAVTVSQAAATNVAVTLNQLAHVAFVIRDIEQAKSFKNLRDEFLAPASIALAKQIDQCLLGQAIRFRAAFGGALNSLTYSNGVAYILDTRKQLNDNKAPMENRRAIITSAVEAELLKIELFTSAEKVGDQGTALREASLGKKFGIDFFMCQNAPYIASGNTVKTLAINKTGGYAKGTATALAVDGLVGSVATGAWVTIAGEMYPHYLTAHSETSTDTTGITLDSALKAAVADDAVVTVYTPGAVNLTGGYAAGYAKAIAVDGFSVAPQAGQCVKFGAATDVYTIIGVPTITEIWLDRPLDAAIADDAAACIGPAGNYNFMFHRNALALVVRPLPMPPTGLGAGGMVVRDPISGLALRLVMSYEGRNTGLLVNMDVLYGLQILDTALGAVMLG